jgi:fumarate hydratase class I
LSGHRNCHRGRKEGVNRFWTGANDAEWISKGIYETYTKENLRYSQTAPLDMWTEANTGTNLPAQIDLYGHRGSLYDFLFVAKGGGSANKTFLFQETKALLNPKSLEKFVADKLSYLGTAACPPYHLVFVIGGTRRRSLPQDSQARVDQVLRLPSHDREPGGPGRSAISNGRRRFSQLPRPAESAHNSEASISPSTSASSACHGMAPVVPSAWAFPVRRDRNIKARITRDGIFLEKLETNPGQYIPASQRFLKDETAVHIDLNRSMPDILAELSRLPVTTRVLLTGPLVVARDIAHAKLKERVDAGLGLPDYLKNHPVYYAGPAKTPKGYASGSFGPTTAGRMDSYVDQFQSLGGSMVMLAKGQSQPCRHRCMQEAPWFLSRQHRRPRCHPGQGKHPQGRTPRVPPNLAWRRSGRSRSKTSRLSFSSTTRAMTSSSMVAAPACR